MNEKFKDIILKPSISGKNTPIQNIEAFHRKEIKTYKAFEEYGKLLHLFLEAGDLIDTQIFKEVIMDGEYIHYAKKGIFQFGYPVDNISGVNYYPTVSVSQGVYHPIMYIGILADAKVERYQCDECGQFFDDCHHAIDFYLNNNE